ncbi:MULTISPECIES: toll/interleukin-1 receptor domain-containing protein [unclassified Streptomyces]|uniref:toll/interleukin-1 receptor domain-containing protein n=1 Tax=unclassified Streptomyces TaxID=2593676 RepID=UPI00099B9ED8|nr:MULTISPECIES: toll/interleukin-1 receptor domain-containing protein [unclassified Streptomyces]
MGELWGKAALGKIFISHSSADKSFIRSRIVAPLEKLGYKTWLDEKELMPGDPLPRRVAQGIREAKVLIVVVSISSVKSDWLRYELNVAVDLMIKGSLRLVPVIIDQVQIPSELESLLYADMRKGMRGGFKKIATALEYEAARYPKPASQVSVASEFSYLRGQAYETILADEAGRGFFHAWTDVSATRSINWSGFTVLNVDVRVDMVHNYVNRNVFDSSDLDDWMAQLDETSVDFALLIFEGDIKPEATASFSQPKESVWVQTFPESLLTGSRSHIIIEAGAEKSPEQIEKSLRDAVKVMTKRVANRRPSILEATGMDTQLRESSPE